jgi:hypothetical protein
MIEHPVDTYHDIQSQGVEFLRNIYTKGGLAIRLQSKLSKLDIMKEFARAQDWMRKRSLRRKPSRSQ